MRLAGVGKSMLVEKVHKEKVIDGQKLLEFNIPNYVDVSQEFRPYMQTSGRPFV